MNINYNSNKGHINMKKLKTVPLAQKKIMIPQKNMQQQSLPPCMFLTYLQLTVIKDKYI